MNKCENCPDRDEVWSNDLGSFVYVGNCQVCLVMTVGRPCSKDGEESPNTPEVLRRIYEEEHPALVMLERLEKPSIEGLRK